MTREKITGVLILLAHTLWNLGFASIFIKHKPHFSDKHKSHPRK